MSGYKQMIIKLIDSDITGHQIHKATELSQTVLSALRTESCDTDN
ncbi:hypothetical protein [Staphylococcus equorum]|nr:hypothetical protein [Staphylococcus equorum]